MSKPIRFDWGPTGAAAVVAPTTVVVDVLSFTTTLTVAVERGITVYPFRWRDERATAYAEERDAVLATGRSLRDAVSLSSASARDAVGVERLVLPSPNGSSIAFGLAEAGVTVVGASLRNASAVARWLHERGGDVAVVAAGERWPDGSLRPAVEDLWGAGAVIAALVDLGVSGLSPEARVAEQAFRAARLPADLVACASGQELVEMGFAEDVEVAAELDASSVVPVLRGDAFVDVRTRDADDSEEDVVGGPRDHPDAVQIVVEVPPLGKTWTASSEKSQYPVGARRPMGARGALRSLRPKKTAPEAPVAPVAPLS